MFFLVLANLVSRFISGDTAYQAPDIQFFATYGWSELGNKKYNQLLLKRPPKIYPDFDSERMHAYLDLMSEGSKFGEIKIPVTEIKYGIDGHILSQESYNMTPGEYVR